MGARSVVVKGGHRKGAATDVLYDGTLFYEFPARRVRTKNTHGTGCTYSAALGLRPRPEQAAGNRGCRGQRLHHPGHPPSVLPSARGTALCIIFTGTGTRIAAGDRCFPLQLCFATPRTGSERTMSCHRTTLSITCRQTPAIRAAETKTLQSMTTLMSHGCGALGEHRRCRQ